MCGTILSRILVIYLYPKPTPIINISIQILNTTASRPPLPFQGEGGREGVLMSEPQINQINQITQNIRVILAGG